MPDHVPRHRDIFLNDRTRTVLWVEWQRRRRHPDYGPAVDACLTAMAVYEDQERGQTLQDILEANALLRQHAFPFTGENAASTGGIDEYMIGWLALALKRLCQPEVRTLFPPLAAFAHAWILRLPLDPAISALPDWVAASVFPRTYDITLTYRWVYEELSLWPQDDRELVVEFRIRQGASHDELREQFDAILAAHASWNRPRLYRHRGNQRYYEQVFHAFDLSIQGRTLPAIAQQLWPNEWHAHSERLPTHQTLLQRARGHVTRARALIHGEQK